MSPVTMPEEFLKPKDRFISEVETSKRVWIDFTQILVQTDSRSTYVRSHAKIYADGMVPLRFPVQRTEGGIILFIPEQSNLKPEFRMVQEIPGDAIPVIEIRKVKKA